MPRRRRRIHARPLRLYAASALALLLVALYAASWLTEFSTLSASAPMPSARTIAPAGTPGYGQRYERSETHFMLGRGSFIVHSMLVHTEGPFTHPSARMNSIHLGRAVVYEQPSLWTRFRLSSSKLGPDVYLPLWFPTAVALALAAVLFWRRRCRPIPGHCRCGYRLAGLPPGLPCPECGRVGAVPPLTTAD